MPPPLPPDEAARLEALSRYDILDTAPEVSFERITALAARLFEVPVALITLVDERRQWFKSCVGLDFAETTRDDSFCGYTILGTEVMVVPDTHLDPRFQTNPYVVGAPHARFYVGAPLVTTDGFCLGSLCLLDTVPRSFSEAQSATLQDLAAVVVEALEARRASQQKLQLEARRRLEELEVSERRRASVIDCAFDGIIVFDGEGRILEFNPAAEEMFGHPRTDVLGRPMGETLIPPELRPTHPERLKAITAAADAGTLRHRVEQWGLHADGHRFPAEISAVRSPGVEPPQYVGIVRDITERKAADAALQRQQEIQEETGRMAQVGGWEYDVVTRQTTWTPEMYHLYDLEPGQAPDVEQTLSYFLPESQELVRNALQAAVESGTPYEVEVEIVTPKGNRKWIHSIGRPVFEDGRVTKLRGARQDITARKHAEASLELFRSLVDNTADTIEVIDPATGRFLDVNDHGPKCLGYTREEYLTLCVGDVAPELAGEAWTRQVERIHREGMVSGESRHRRKDGTSFPVEYKSQWVQLDRDYIVASVRDITERKVAEDERLAAEGRYRALFENAPDGILIADPDNYNLDVNPRLCRLLGYEPEELVGLHVSDMVTEERHHRIPAALEAMRSKEGFHAESVFRRKDGSPVDVEVKGSQMPDGNYLAIVRDITDRKEAQEALRRSEGRLQAVIEHMSEGLIIARLDGELLHWNPAALEMHGVTNFEESMARFRANVSMLEFATLDGRVLPASEWPLAKLFRRDFLRGYELRLTKKTGDWQRVCRYNGAIVREPGGEELAFLTISDITESTCTQARLRRLVESNVQGVIFWNRAGELLDANDAFLELFGYTREDLVAGRINWIEMTPPQFHESDQRVIAQLDAVGSCPPFEKEYKHKDGTPIPILMGAALFEDNPSEGVCFVLDLRERKQLEAQFLRSQRMESIGTLAGGIAHDLNNALGPVITGLQLMEMRFPDEASQKWLAMIRSSAMRGADMVKQVLSFARGISGERLTVQLRYLVKEVADIATDTFPKNIVVQTRVPGDLWSLTGDATQIHQVLLNLCVNARDAMPRGGTLTISAENVTLDAHYAGLSNEAKAGPYIVLQVADSGEGIPSEILEKIFDPFFTTKEVGKGTGLGLSTTVGIVKSHGGFVRVYSEVGRGSQFKLYLPADTDSAGTEARPLEEELPRGRGEWVLLVDDEPVVREVTTQTLQAYGYQVVVAADGAEALAMYAPRMGEIAAAVIDMMMPVMDGPALMQVLQRMNPGLPMVAASGLSSNAQVARATGLGVQHFLPKPYTASALLTVLRQVLSAVRASGPGYQEGGEAT